MTLWASTTDSEFEPAAAGTSVDSSHLNGFVKQSSKKEQEKKLYSFLNDLFKKEQEKKLYAFLNNLFSVNARPASSGCTSAYH